VGDAGGVGKITRIRLEFCFRPFGPRVMDIFFKGKRVFDGDPLSNRMQ
jgi:hypothetical protein